jgi:hypothetical protein
MGGDSVKKRLYFKSAKHKALAVRDERQMVLYSTSKKRLRDGVKHVEIHVPTPNWFKGWSGFWGWVYRTTWEWQRGQWVLIARDPVTSYAKVVGDIVGLPDHIKP